MMRSMVKVSWLVAALVLVLLLPVVRADAVGKYVLAYWRELGEYENSSNHSVFVHVYNENGTARANVPIAQVGGGVLTYTDTNGRCEIPLYSSDFAITVADGSNEADPTPPLNERRPAHWGHYSWECAWMYKTDRNNPGQYDQTFVGTPNTDGQAPCTKSLIYWGTNPLNWSSDAYELDTGSSAYYQTFTVPSGVNRVMALKFHLTRGYGTKMTWTAQICSGTPPGTPVGPSRTTRELNSDDYWQILLSWGVNDVQVTAGQTYCVKLTEASGSFNIWRQVNNNYAGGQMYRNLTAVPDKDLQGLVVGMNYEVSPLIITNEAATGSTGSITVTWTTNVGATSRVDYGTTSSYGQYVYDSNLVTSHSMTISNLHADTEYHFKITSTRSGFPDAVTGDKTVWTASATPNLLSNWGFENGTFPPWQQSPTIFEIGGWCTWGPCPYEGAKDAVSAVSYGKKNGYLYQVASGAIVGQTYTARGWIQTRQTGGYNTDVAAKIGLDPTGGTDPGGASVVWSPEYSSQETWMPIGVSAVAQSTNLTFAFQQIHKWNLQWNINAYDACSLTGPAQGAIKNLKAYPDGTPVVVSGNTYVTATSAQMGGALYIESEDRGSGIRVVSGSTVAEGQKVGVSGWLATVNGERQIIDATVNSLTGTKLLAPLVINNKSLGGVDLNQYAKGATKAYGPNNVGLLVQTAGRVVNPSGTGYRYITDGSGDAVKIDTSGITNAPSVGQFVTVKGISRLEKVGNDYVPVVRPRANADMVVVPG